MTHTALERTILRLEREISGTSEAEKAKAAERLRALLLPKRPVASFVTYEEDDLFDNMPV